MSDDNSESRELLIMSNPTDDYHMNLYVIVVVSIVLLIIFRAFFTFAETAVISLNDNKIKKMAEDNHKGAIRVVKLTSSPNNFFATFDFCATLCSLFIAGISAKSYTDILAININFYGISYIIRQIIALLIIIAVVGSIYIIFGDLIPKRIAVQTSEKIAFAVSAPLLFIYNLFKPVIFIMSSITSLFVKIMGFDPNGSEKKGTEEEIMMMVDAGEEKGFIEETAKDMIAGIFDFDDLTAGEVMTHRRDVVAVSDNSELNEAVNLAIKGGYSRIPVFHNDIDNIVGIIYVKDLLKYVCTNVPDVKVLDIMREPLFVPRTRKCSELFSEMTESKTQIVIVIDEYGGTEGILTMEDLVECIVGNIQDEYDNEDEYIKNLGDNKFLVDGSVSIDDIEENIGITIKDNNFETIAGLILEKIGHIPQNNEKPSVIIDNTIFTVDKIEDRRISKILIEKQINTDSIDESNKSSKL